jgi:hypothetical protein
MAQAKHQQGLKLLEKQQLAGALRLLGKSLPGRNLLAME